MPQDNLIDPPEHRLTGLRLEITEVVTTNGVAWQANVARRHADGDWGTVHSARYSGVMQDCLPEWASGLVGTFFYGPGGEELFRDARSAHRVARAHQETWEEQRGRVVF